MRGAHFVRHSSVRAQALLPIANYILRSTDVSSIVRHGRKNRTMTKTFPTHTIDAEAARTAAVPPCRFELVDNGRRPGTTDALVGRPVR
jgi:hypothetical protein